MQGVEVDLLLHRLERGDLFLIDAQLVVRLAEGQVHAQLAEIRRVVRPRLALVDAHHVRVDVLERLRLEVIPELLDVGDDPLVGDGGARDLRIQPAGRHADLLVVHELIEELADDVLRLEGAVIERGAALARDRDLVGGRADRRFLEYDGLGGQLEVAREDLRDRVQLQEPARRRVGGLLLPLGRRPRLRESDRDLLDRLALDGGLHHLVDPAEALLVGREHRHRRLARAGLDQLIANLGFELPPDLGRLAQPRLDDDRLLLLRRHRRHHLALDQRAQVVDL